MKTDTDDKNNIQQKNPYNSLKDFLWWTTDDIIPMYIFASYYGQGVGSLAEEVKKIDPKEFSNDIYYLVDYEMVKHETKVNGATQYTNSAQLKAYKVVDNLLSYAIFEVPKEDLDKIGFFGTMQKGCKFKLPPIPLAMVEKMDLFFRAVHEKYRSESIVLLTYNPKVGGSEGWDILVPKQSNNAGHCSYEPSSISDLHSSDVFIAGSAHSHPLMSAYASGTDHSDQADFDGLHITYGWSTKTGMQTEYYAEIQVQDESWPISTDLIFEVPKVEEKDVPKELLKLIEEKVAEEPISISSWNEKQKANAYGNGSYSSGYKPNSYPKPGDYISQKNFYHYKNYLEVLNNPIVVGIIPGLIEGRPSDCPFCGTRLVVPEINHRRCMSCTGYIMDKDESLSDMVEARQEMSLSSYELSDLNKNLVKDVYIWDSSEKVPADAFTPAIQVEDYQSKK